MSAHNDHEHNDHAVHDHSEEHDHQNAPVAGRSNGHNAEHHDHGGHDHDHDHDHNHDHGHKHSLWESIAEALHLPGYAHDHASLAEDATVYDNALAIRTVWLSLFLLAFTTILQIGIYLVSGSVALLGDTVHNLGDALNSLPLLLAFWLLKRKPNRRYTYGYGRAEDVAGLVIVASIAFSAIYIFWESIQKLIHPEPLQNLGWVALASIIGFIGNEGVAMLEIRVGRKINSAAMLADGVHARTDGLTSLAVLAAVIFTWLGFPIADPIIGILIAIMIVFIARDAIISTWYRLMDAVDPKLVDKVEATIKTFPDVKQIHRLQMRWLGHRLYAETVLAFDGKLSTEQIEALTDTISHTLYHEMGSLAEVTIAVVPYSPDGKQVFWRESAHHRVVASTPAQ